MARVPYVDPEALPDGDDHLLRTSMDAADLPEEGRHLFTTEVRNVHRAIGNNVPVLRGFREMNRTVWRHSGLTARQRELVILAVARATGSRYEWHQHVRHALSVGLGADEIRAISREDHADFPSIETALLDYATAAATGSVEAADFDPFEDAFDVETTVGVTMLVSAYAGLALALDAMAVEPEEPFVGWDLDGL